MMPKILEISWDIMRTGLMILAGSGAFTLAIVIPFAVYGGLHSIFCK